MPNSDKKNVIKMTLPQEKVFEERSWEKNVTIKATPRQSSPVKKK